MINNKKLPNFKNEDAERDFWATKNVSDVFDPKKAIKIQLPNLKPSKERISLRLPTFLLSAIKLEANKRDIPYQSLIKERLFRDFVSG
jgi:predicted DNA binding CopG/RHH family protein